jgi:hypothetical protein
MKSTLSRFGAMVLPNELICLDTVDGWQVVDAFAQHQSKQSQRTALPMTMLQSSLQHTGRLARRTFSDL